jgi:hypothetical protein
MMANKARILLYAAFGAFALATIVLYSSSGTLDTVLDETAAAPGAGLANVDLDYGKNNKGSVQVFLKSSCCVS